MSTQHLPPRKPTILIIMDGVGVNPAKSDNAVALAKTPNLDRIFSRYPTTILEASGKAVGLPDGQMGNSEVGHLTIGAGAVLRQDLVKIDDAIEDGSFQQNPALQQAVTRAQKSSQVLHLIGLTSDGGIHSHIDHLIALIGICQTSGVRPLVHMITDGRDTAPKCATKFVRQLAEPLNRASGQIASICGRFYAMDRDRRWERVERAWKMLTAGIGHRADSAISGIEEAWHAGQSDEFLEPIILPGFEPINADAEVVFFNFRNDRPRELVSALAIEGFDDFQRGDYNVVSMTTMTPYHANYPFPVAFEKEEPTVTLGQIVSEHGLQQLRAAETEKYPHVTFFFSGGREEPFPGESRNLIDSPKVETYDLQPEMSAYPLAEATIDALSRQAYALIVVNFANGDMVGHTGVRDAVIRAVEVVDQLVGQVCESALNNGYSVLLTADHGNADMLIDPITLTPHTKHTTFPVACTIMDQSMWGLATGRGLPSIAPTILQLMGLPQPPEMTGKSLLLEELS